jgi:hypothetical protein
MVLGISTKLLYRLIRQGPHDLPGFLVPPHGQHPRINKPIQIQKIDHVAKAALGESAASSFDKYATVDLLRSNSSSFACVTAPFRPSKKYISIQTSLRTSRSLLPIASIPIQENPYSAFCHPHSSF